MTTESSLDLEHPSPAPRPVARVNGEPLAEMPFDLYIPPEALEVFLETFVKVKSGWADNEAGLRAYGYE